jgi:hypothetical protein
MACSCKIFNTDATIGSLFVLQFLLKEDDGTVIDITDYRVAMTAKSKTGSVIFTADSQAESATVTLDAETGATIEVQVPEDIAPQVADFNILIADESGNIPIIRGELTLLSQITDLTE